MEDFLINGLKPSLALAPLVIPLIMAASGIASGLIAHNQNKKTNQANMRLAEYQASANEKYLDKMNQYNTPAAQMSRFDQAGLNPNLIYGQGNSGNQSQPARYEAPRVDYRFNPFDLPQVLGPFQDYQLRSAQIDSIKASTENTRTEIGNKLLARLLTQVRTARGEFDLKQSKVLAPYNADIKHGQAQSAYTKLLQEFAKLDGMKLRNLLTQEQIGGTAASTAKKQAELLFQNQRNKFIEHGVTTSDHPLLRMIIQMMGSPSWSVDQDKIQRDLKLK